MRMGMGAVATAAVLVSGGLAPGSVQARDQTPTPQVLMFHCRVEAGPRFAACAPKDRTDLDPRKVANLRQAIETMPACLMTDVAPGTEVDRPIRFLDTADLLKPPPPPPSEESRHTVVNPDWAQRPTAELLQRVYPPAAKAAHTAGSVVLDCEVAADGGAGCAVAEETPEGQGFGAAALQASHEFRFRPRQVDCRPVGGAHIRVPLNFRL